jgi:hypothetical protein
MSILDEDRKIITEQMTWTMGNVIHIVAIYNTCKSKKAVPLQ